MDTNLKLKQKYEIAERRFENLQSEMEDILFDIAARVDDYRNDYPKNGMGQKIGHSYRKFEFEDYGQSHAVICYWRDYWGFGGEDSGETKFPLQLFFHPEKVEGYVKNLDQIEEDKKIKEKEWAIKSLESQLNKLKAEKQVG